MRSGKRLYQAEDHKRREGVNENWIPCEKQGFWDGGSEALDTTAEKNKEPTGSILAECTTGEAGRKHVCQRPIGEHRKRTKTSMFYIKFKEHFARMIARGFEAAAEGPTILRWGNALARKRQCCSSNVEKHFHPLSDPHSRKISWNDFPIPAKGKPVFVPLHF
jgi:hypothetical protein